MTYGFPLAAPGQRIGLLGGSFDPPHEGHVAVSHAALKRFGLDRVWWLVSPGNPLKPHSPAAMDARIAAARALTPDPRIHVTDIEARMGTRLTADTIAALIRRYPAVRFVWLMGSDNMVQFAQWERWREIARQVPIGVVARPGSRLAARGSEAARKLEAGRRPQSDALRLASIRPPAWMLINMPMKAVSSTALRTCAEGGLLPSMSEPRTGSASFEEC